MIASERKINLDLILARFFSWDSKTGEVSYCNILDLKWAMKGAIKQALELAAENAKAGIDADESAYIEGNVWGIADKQSILDIINQIE